MFLRTIWSKSIDQFRNSQILSVLDGAQDLWVRTVADADEHPEKEVRDGLLIAVLEQVLDDV